MRGRIEKTKYDGMKRDGRERFLYSVDVESEMTLLLYNL